MSRVVHMADMPRHIHPSTQRIIRRHSMARVKRYNHIAKLHAAAVFAENELAGIENGWPPATEEDIAAARTKFEALDAVLDMYDAEHVCHKPKLFRTGRWAMPGS